ncbi:MAG TPA: SET domain-containing protein [Ignavibacteria bacterium]|nr:SET domain-containing protein [Ignavibacteria bacterium]
MIFELRASAIHGVGVFTLVKIKKGSALILFEEDDFRFIKKSQIRKTGLPESLIRKYSIKYSDGYSSPRNFHRMSIGWYLNHSDDPNVYHNSEYEYFALRDIKKDEEITIDYDRL